MSMSVAPIVLGKRSRIENFLLFIALLPSIFTAIKLIV